jgi:glycerol-3-phosphate acyltransferase PlsX
MAAALLRYGRIRGAARPAIGVPIPVPFGSPQLLVDGGANVDCRPEWLFQFALMGRAYARLRLTDVDEPTVGLLSNGEEPGKGDDLRKRTFAMLDGRPWFVGNVEGRDLMSGHPHVIVTDGFTGNVAIKTVEGALKAAANLVFTTLGAPEAKEAADVVAPLLLQGVTDYLDPDTIGGAALLGVAGVCVISHGSSGPRAIVNAVQLAADCVTGGLVDRMQDAIVEPSTGKDQGVATVEEEAYAG